MIILMIYKTIINKQIHRNSTTHNIYIYVYINKKREEYEIK